MKHYTTHVDQAYMTCSRLYGSNSTLVRILQLVSKLGIINPRYALFMILDCLGKPFQLVLALLHLN